MIIVCEICLRDFVTQNNCTNHKYCDSCTTRLCGVCHEEFKFKPKAKKDKKFCSRACYWESLKGKKQPIEFVKKRAESNQGRKTGDYVECRFCSNKFYLEPSRLLLDRQRRFCSAICFVNWSKTDDNPTWRGEEYKMEKKLRNSWKYKKWRKCVRERDNSTCLICGYKSNGVGYRDIHIDHIDSFALYPEKRFDTGNGRVLCVPCHRKTDTWGINSKYQTK